MDEDEAAGTGGQFGLAGGSGPEDANGMVEIEHEGQRYEVPSALENAFLARQDYEQKHAMLEGQARDLDARRRSFAQEAELAEARLEDRAQLHVLDLQLAAYAGVDWRSLASENPERAQWLWAHFQQAQRVREDFAQALAHSQDRHRLESERSRAAQFAEAGQVLNREIEGWSPDVAQKLVEYAAAFGVTIDELRDVADHRLWRILHRAFQGDEQAKRQSAAETAERAQAVRPAVVIAGAAAGSGGVRDDLGTREWMRRRNAQAAQAHSR